jgi:hypothetical protein
VPEFWSKKNSGRSNGGHVAHLLAPPAAAATAHALPAAGPGVAATTELLLRQEAVRRTVGFVVFTRHGWQAALHGHPLGSLTATYPFILFLLWLIRT